MFEVITEPANRTPGGISSRYVDGGGRLHAPCGWPRLAAPCLEFGIVSVVSGSSSNRRNGTRSARSSVRGRTACSQPKCANRSADDRLCRTVSLQPRECSASMPRGVASRNGGGGRRVIEIWGAEHPVVVANKRLIQCGEVALYPRNAEPYRNGNAWGARLCTL